jgi:hypothetical protein
LRRTNNDGRVAVLLASYFVGGSPSSVMRGRPGTGEVRRLRVQGEARVVGGGSQTMVVRIKGVGDPPQTYLGEQRERLTSDAWKEFTALFELPFDKDCHVRFDDRSVTDPPSTLELRDVVVWELKG